MKGKSLYLKLHTDSASSGGNRGVSTRIADKGAMKPFLTEAPKPLKVSVLVIFKQPQENGKNVKRFDDVDPTTIDFGADQDLMMLWEVPIELSEISSIQIVPQPQGVKKDGKAQ